ncbi:MAG: T9SS type A sorting domain-containing protein [Bacteroidia bacterium]|nr:T9SS type A sorting domain-containing protein [Bacteroidia bacterium]
MKNLTNALFAILTGILLLGGLSNQAFAQCVIDSGVPSVPGIYPAQLNDADGCEYYEMDITFFLPRDTTVSFAGQNLTFPFNYFSIDSITGLPPGLTWDCNLDTCIYYVHPDSANVDTLGCVRVFGTPTSPGFFPVVVHITANVIIFNNPTDQAATYNASLKVGPCPFVGDCYTYNLSSFCEPVVLDLDNNIPSNGNPGFSYFWNLTGPDGPVYSTSDENPFQQVLTEGGDYILEYEATIDTSGFFLTSVVIENVNCSDLLDAGDLYWILKDPNGNELVNTSANPVTNGGANLPLNTTITTFQLDTGVYEFQVWDEDQLTGDDGCATNTNGSGASVFLTIPPLNAGDITVVNSGLTVKFTVDHPVQVISCTDTLHVDSLPAIPVIFADTNWVCPGDSLALIVNTSDSIQWYRDGNLIAGMNDSILMADQAGDYIAEVIDRNTLCVSSSAVFEVQAILIIAPSIAFDGSFTLTIASPNPAYTYQWYNSNGTPAGSGASWMPAGSGNYYAVAVDTLSGCQSGPSPTIRAILSAIDPLADILQNFHLYPNPNKGEFTVEGELFSSEEVSLEIQDILGRNLYHRETKLSPGRFNQPVSVAGFAPGVYIFRWVSPKGVLTRKFVIER